jgi:hypothetical protein
MLSGRPGPLLFRGRRNCRVYGLIYNDKWGRTIITLNNTACAYCSRQYSNPFTGNRILYKPENDNRIPQTLSRLKGKVTCRKCSTVLSASHLDMMPIATQTPPSLSTAGQRTGSRCRRYHRRRSRTCLELREAKLKLVKLLTQTHRLVGNPKRWECLCAWG